MTESARAVTLYLIRHGMADGVEGRCIGHADVPLSARGRAQCLALAAAWRPPASATIWSSDLARARDSARVLTDAWNRPPQPNRIDAALRECSFGAWDGRAWADIEASDAAQLSAWMQNWSTIAPPGGESLPMLMTRVLGVLRLMLTSDASTHVVVSHAGVLRAILNRVLDAPDTAHFRWAMPHAHVSAVQVSGVTADGIVHGSVEWLHAFPPPSDR